MVCLQETKISTMTRTILVDTLGPDYAGFCTLDAVGIRGGILLGWHDESVLVTNIDVRNFTVSATVKVLTDAGFMITTCYGPATDNRKEEFLQEIQATKPLAGVPWLILGDFNLIYKASDKNNLNLNRRLMGKFRAALDSCELIEICLQNRKYTWSNERENSTMVRLDRAFCNPDWEMLLPHFALQALSTGASDHCPILLRRQEIVPTKARFRFEDHWLHTEGF
jgi:exonuclease III